MECAMAEKEDDCCCNAYSVFSLFPGEYGVWFDHSKLNKPVIELDYVHQRLNSEVKTIGENEEAGVAAIEQPRKRRPDSPTNMDNEVDKFLDELLSDICKDLNEDEAINLSHKRLQIKPIELEKLSFPQREGFKDINQKSPIGNFEKLHNLVKGRTPQKKKQRNDDMPQNAFCRMFSLLGSPPLSKSLFASWTSLKKSLCQPNSLNYQFSAHDMDELPTRNLSLFDGTNEQCGPSRKHSSVSHGQWSTSHVESATRSNQNGSNEKRAIGEKSHGSNEKADDIESSNANVMEDHATNALEVVQKEIQKCEVTLKKGRRQHKVHKDTKRLRRQSLEADATRCESGLRRSTRIRVRPLKFWQGERLLYGRIHPSLATVIGVKYVSRVKAGGLPTFKVKSFVPDQYKDLVNLAALH